MAINLERKPPGIVGILFGAVLSVSLGVLLGVLHLVAQPVEVVTSEPKEPAEGARYFIKGSSGGSATWEGKHSQLTEGSGEVAITEGELNAWSGETFEEVKVEQAEKDSSVLIIAGAPNFRLVGETLQVGTENKLVFFGGEAPLVLQAKGGFERVGERWKFNPAEAYLGGLPLHRVPALMGVAAKRFGPAATMPADVEKVLTQATQIALQDGELVVRMP